MLAYERWSQPEVRLYLNTVMYMYCMCRVVHASQLFNCLWIRFKVSAPKHLDTQLPLICKKTVNQNYLRSCFEIYHFRDMLFEIEHENKTELLGEK